MGGGARETSRVEGKMTVIAISSGVKDTLTPSQGANPVCSAECRAPNAELRAPYHPSEPAAALRGHPRIVRVGAAQRKAACTVCAAAFSFPFPLPLPNPPPSPPPPPNRQARRHRAAQAYPHLPRERLPSTDPPRRGQDKLSVRVTLARPPSGRARRATRTRTATPAMLRSTCLAGKRKQHFPSLDTGARKACAQRFASRSHSGARSSFLQNDPPLHTSWSSPISTGGFTARDRVQGAEAEPETCYPWREERTAQTHRGRETATADARGSESYRGYA
ncbi:hypothetical protein B0H19DRAFT_1274826 [Mycena capillaripes]|nr:hypothetical protein B0H19DRAFT_1274826 [Mycena capillaripes]